MYIYIYIYLCIYIHICICMYICTCNITGEVLPDILEVEVSRSSSDHDRSLHRRSAIIIYKYANNNDYDNNGSNE